VVVVVYLQLSDDIIVQLRIICLTSIDLAQKVTHVLDRYD